MNTAFQIFCHSSVILPSVDISIDTQNFDKISNPPTLQHTFNRGPYVLPSEFETKFRTYTKQVKQFRILF
jgi:hypothetical protein